MRPFAYSRPQDIAGAMSLTASGHTAKFLGGGTNLLDLMKMGVENPSQLVDITRLPLAAIAETPNGIRIGATAKNSDVAAHPLIRERYSLLSQALLAGASPQIRNMATVGGNAMQRTRCFYFYDPTYKQCNKRVPGSGCAALNGFNRIHAILGTSDHCIATHPGDMSVALTTLDARFIVRGKQGERSIPAGEFYRLPGSNPQIETELKPGELITAVEIPAPPSASQSHYLKVRDRNSFAFALVSAAALVDLDGNNRIREARLTLGGVAHKPWRLPAAEKAMHGKEPGEEVFRSFAAALTHGARTQRYNAFKAELARRVTVRALLVASERS